VNCIANGVNYPTISTGVSANGAMMFSPFYMCGAYFTGIPDKSTLDIRGFYYLERFPAAELTDLVILANPSPGYDPLALELMTRTALKMPCGTPVKNNAIGDWIKTIADVAGVFGVPGMPIVKGAVDLVNGGLKAYKTITGANNNGGGGWDAKASFKGLNSERKFAEKNQKRQNKGKQVRTREAWQQKKMTKKQRKAALQESRAGMASGGSK